MTLKSVLSSFDQPEKKGFDFHEILRAFTFLDKDELVTSEYMYEVLAFRLVYIHGESTWGTSYGPMVTNKDQNDNLVCFPSYDEITTEAIEYWSNRLDETSNPLLKMRYAGLVWEFEYKVANRKHSNDLYNKYVKSLLEVCNGDYCSHFIITVNVLERLFGLIKANPQFLSDVKAAYKSFENRHAKDENVRAWASRFLLMLMHKKSFTDEEKGEIVKEHEARLARLSTSNVGGRVNPWLVKEQVTLLAKYYDSIQSADDVKRVLNVEEQVFMCEEGNMSAMQMMGNLEQVYREYRLYHLEKEASRLSIEIQKFGEKSKAEMQPYQIDFEIPKETFERADLMFGDKALSDEKRWQNFCTYFIPTVDDEKKSLKQLAESFPLMYISTTNLVDWKGRPISVVGSYESDPDGQLILHITQKMELEAYFLRLAINRLLNTKTLTADKVMNLMIKPSPVFDEERYDIIKDAIQYFVDAKYDLFCHLIVPQIEYAICNLVEKSGAAVLKPQRSGNGFQLRTLDDLLREQIIAKMFTEDGAFYLRLVLTDQRALNIRNLLCHGLMPPAYFGAGAAARLLHVLSMLGLLRE